MATKLIKPLRRELLAQVQTGKHRGRQILVELQPGDVLSFRIKGTRQTFETSLHSAFVLAQLVTFDRLYQDKLKEYERRKKAGARVKRPKRPAMFVSKVFIQTLKLS